VSRKSIRNQVIVITGASSGIGLATARMAAKRGAKVVLSSRNEADLFQIVNEIRERGGDATAVAADVAILAEMQTLADRAVAHYGRIDTWVNNAGTSIYGYLMDTPIEEERKLFDINFWGIVHGCRVAVPVLAQKGGTLINLGSEVSARSIPLQGMYAATKHAIKAYTDALRMELEKNGSKIEVCLIRPAGIDTPYTQHARSHLKSGAPSLPNPVYHPDVVADAILHCAEHPQRDVYIGGPSRLFALLETLAPSLTDLFIEKTQFSAQSKGKRKFHSEDQEGLMHAPRKEGSAEGDHRGPVQLGSLYTSITTHHPVAGFLVGAGTAAVAIGAIRYWGFSTIVSELAKRIDSLTRAQEPKIPATDFSQKDFVQESIATYGDLRH
jgi:short-subunit dehydrogenase